jgi:D-glycero-D-manno-heptose 1,7-bisphosphate phosphatase
MLLEIARRLGVALRGVPFVGDSWRDVEAARAAGASPVLVRTGYGRRTLAADHDLRQVEIHDDLARFVDAFLARNAGDAP